MESQNTYKSFNTNKTIEELQYNMQQYKSNIQEVKVELEFFKYLIQASIYKANVINLFERLEQFKENINNSVNEINNLLDQVKKQTNQINNKIECEDLACDNFFINEYEKIEESTINFLTEIASLKSQLFQYLQSVIKN